MASWDKPAYKRHTWRNAHSRNTNVPAQPSNKPQLTTIGVR